MISEQKMTEHITTKVRVREVPWTKVSLDRILVATDFSPAADRALEYAVSLARHYGSHLYVAHVATLNEYPLISPELAIARAQKCRDEAKAAMAKLLRSGRLFGVSYDAVIEEGALWQSIQELIKKFGVHLVVAGTHGMGSFEKILFGSNAEQMFRQSSVPILAVGPSAPSEPLYEAEFRHILFATDFGQGAEKEAAFALSLAREHRSRLTVLHVSSDAEEARGLRRDFILSELKELVPDTHGEHCLVQFKVAFGKPVVEILRAREEVSADLIVMGAKNRMSLAGHALRTIAFEVVSAAPCPVLTVRS
jgi:nucleotide-binding universal stress UspA family protein